MTRNVGGMDKRVRLIVGVICLALALFVDVGTAFKIVLWVLAAIGILTGTLMYCPINHMLGVNTAEPKEGGPS